MRKKKGWSCILAAVGLVLVGGCLLITSAVIGVNEYKNLPRLVTGFNFGTSQINKYSYSDQQQALLNEWGRPPGFNILFYQEENAQGQVEIVRTEEWQYPQRGMQVVYENGIEVSRGQIDATGMHPAIYEPAQFLPFMNREQLASLTGINEWFILPVEEELVHNADLYYAGGLMFGLQNDELVYVEAVAFGDENASVILPTAIPTTVPTTEPATEPMLALTPEETANQGTHTYEVVLVSGEEVLEEDIVTVQINFYEGGCEIILEGDGGHLIQNVPNQYHPEDDESTLVTFHPDGFSWKTFGEIEELIFRIKE